MASSCGLHVDSYISWLEKNKNNLLTFHEMDFIDSEAPETSDFFSSPRTILSARDIERKINRLLNVDNEIGSVSFDENFWDVFYFMPIKIDIKIEEELDRFFLKISIPSPKAKIAVDFYHNYISIFYHSGNDEIFFTNVNTGLIDNNPIYVNIYAKVNFKQGGILPCEIEKTLNNNVTNYKIEIERGSEFSFLPFKRKK